jgi:predicted secreted hydrolase
MTKRYNPRLDHPSIPPHSDHSSGHAAICPASLGSESTPTPLESESVQADFVARGHSGAISFAGRLLLLLLALLLAGCGLPGTIAKEGHIPNVGPAPTSTPLPPVQLPQDEAPHRDLTEWWYYTGHFAGADAHGQQHTYGFELTVFQTLRGQLPPYYAAHYAISDLTRGQFYYAERSAFGSFAALPPPNSTSGFNLPVGDWRINGLDGHDMLHAMMDGYAIDLALADQHPRVALHGGDGVITYGVAGFSYYYSRPLMAVSGAILDHGVTVNVTGHAWFDHQWGDFVSLAGAGWDWFSIQLSNSTQYMLYIIRDEQKRPISVVGTTIAQDGSTSEIPTGAIHISATSAWTSPHTGGVYPAGWRIELPSISLTETPELGDQELLTQSTGVAYWEGAVWITGAVDGHPITGEGYTELTGYAKLPASAGATPAP